MGGRYSEPQGVKQEVDSRVGSGHTRVERQSGVRTRNNKLEQDRKRLEKPPPDKIV